MDIFYVSHGHPRGVGWREGWRQADTLYLPPDCSRVNWSAQVYVSVWLKGPQMKKTATIPMSCQRLANAASDCCCSHCCCYCNPPSFPNSPLGSVLFESISAARDSWQLLTGIRWGITDCGSALLLKSSCRDREWVLSVQDWEAADGSFSPITIQ